MATQPDANAWRLIKSAARQAGGGSFAAVLDDKGLPQLTLGARQSSSLEVKRQHRLTA
jgi:uncharacterized protein (DUF2236 family)